MRVRARRHALVAVHADAKSRRVGEIDARVGRDAVLFRGGRIRSVGPGETDDDVWENAQFVDFDGKGNDLSHEMTIVRYLADELGLAGEDAFERAKCDELFSQWWCTCRNFGLTHEGEQYSARELRCVTEDDVRCPRYQETHRVNDLSVARRSIQALRVFEEILRANGTGHLVAI